MDDLSCYGEHSVSTLLAHYGTERYAETLQGDKTVKEAMISLDISTEWKPSVGSWLSLKTT